MSTSFKIKSLLLLLTLCFIATAITINQKYSSEQVLEHEAKILQKNLIKKEKIAVDFLENKENFNSLKRIETDEKYQLHVLNGFTKKHGIQISTYKNNQLLFWSSNVLVPKSVARLKEGENFLNKGNGWYLAIKRSSGDFSAICVIPVKWQYLIGNKYLQNTFSQDLVTFENLDIASINDPLVYNIRNQDNKYLFSVKLKPVLTDTFYSNLELWMWLLSILFGSIFMTLVCKNIAYKNHVKTAIALLTAYFLIVRTLNLRSTWFYKQFNLPIFDPTNFSANFFFPTLGDFLINLIAVTWILVFIYNYRNKIRFPNSISRKPISAMIFGLIGLIVGIFAFQANLLFKDLVTLSKINFDLTNILNLTGLSWAGIFLLCLAIFNLYLLIEIALSVGRALRLNWKDRLAIFLSGISVLTVLMIYKEDFDFVFILFALIILVRGSAVYYLRDSEQYNLVIFIFTILVFSVIASIKLSDFQISKEKKQQAFFAQELETPNDTTSILNFKKVEHKIVKDPFFANYFKSTIKRKYLLLDKLDKSYLTDYLDKYEFKAFSFSPSGAVFNQDSVSIDFFKNLVLSRSIKVSDYFYRINNSFAYQKYFAILPIADSQKTLGTLILELKAKTFQESNVPEFLKEGSFDLNKELQKYSFAYYQNGQLLYQNGVFTYNLQNNYRGKLKEFIFKEDNGFSHLIYQSNNGRTIVVSRPLKTFVDQLASASFLFLVLIIFTVIMILAYWLAVNFRDHEFRFHLFNWSYISSQNRILYRTRIQASMVAAIISTLLIVGIITFLSIRTQFRHQKQNAISTEINLLVEGFEKKMFENGRLVYDEETLRQFSSVNASDLNLYDVRGRLIFSTQPGIYENRLIDRHMSALPYTFLNTYQRSEYLGTEFIGNYGFISAYKPIRNNINTTVAYMSLPYYQYSPDIEEQVGSFLNTLINVYALVLVTVGLFAVFVANRITYPLMLVQKSLAAIQIGSKNEPITWKRNDEIGSLIKEYNNMIIALEESALKLARSERESAWREMAKQVAHEIKNPLTPLKLGVQLLEKSWRENDPNFERKFEKFSKSFIEQIESLSHIASEFSNFAKMPVTTYENVDLKEIITRSIEIYSKLNDLYISFEDNSDTNLIVKGDRDQLLRLFNNLVKNAIEAIPDYREGTISIHLKHEDGQAKVEVKDNGKGIPEALRERIFHPNFTTKSSGTGLGLAFVKQAVENMMGTISYVTEPDKGTTFYISIPLAV